MKAVGGGRDKASMLGRCEARLGCYSRPNLSVDACLRAPSIQISAYLDVLFQHAAIFEGQIRWPKTCS